MIQRSQQRRGAWNGTRIMAGLALLFSFLAFLMAGVVMLRTGPEGGGVRENFEAFGEEASRVISEVRARISGNDEADRGSVEGEAATEEAEASEDGADATDEEGGEPGDEGGLALDRIRERVDEIEEKVLAEDKTAGDYIDDLKEDLLNLKEMTKTKGGPLLDDIGDALSKAKDSLAEDSAEAAERLRELSEDLIRRSREQNRRMEAETTPTPEA